MAAEYTLKYTGKELEKLLESVETIAAMLEVDENDNGKILRVVNGEWTAVTIDVYNGEVL